MFSFWFTFASSRQRIFFFISLILCAYFIHIYCDIISSNMHNRISFWLLAQCALIQSQKIRTYVQASCVCVPLNFMVAISELRKFVCGMWMYMVKVYWQLSLLPLSYFIIFIFISFHFVFSIWFNLMWSIQYLFFHHLSIYLSTAHSLSFSSYCPNDGNGCVCVWCVVYVLVCVRFVVFVTMRICVMVGWLVLTFCYGYLPT